MIFKKIVNFNHLKTPKKICLSPEFAIQVFVLRYHTEYQFLVLQTRHNFSIVINLSGGNSPKLEFKGKVLRVNENNEAAIFFEEMDIGTFDRLKNIIPLNDGDPEKIHKEFIDHIKSHLGSDQK